MRSSTICARAALGMLAATAAVLGVVPAAHAAINPTVLLATAGDYSVLGGTTVTNTGNTTMSLNLGVHPGLAVTGFPPGQVVAPGTTHAGDAVALQAQTDLIAAYTDAAGRPVDQTGPADLTGLNLQAGTYATSSKGALLLTGNVILDGAGDPNSVFIFQTDSTLITGSGSTVSLINGAQECNIFWQVGSSATLGTGSSFVGNILALTSISVLDSVTIHGRALARNGAVTLENDTFVNPTCDLTARVPAPVAGVAADDSTGGSTGGAGSDTGNDLTGIEDVPDDTLPRTGAPSGTTVVVALAALAVGTAFVGISRRRLETSH